MTLHLGVKNLEKHLQSYYEHWLERLIDEKVRFVNDTYSVTENMLILEKMYQVYLMESIYLVKMVNREIVWIRSLYKRKDNKFLHTNNEIDLINHNELLKLTYQLLEKHENL